MKRSSLFGHVIELHEIVRTGKRPADTVVGEFFRARHYLGSKDRRFISEILFGLLRHFRLVQLYADSAFRRAGGSPPAQGIPSIALIGAYCTRVACENVDTLMPDLSGLWRVYVSGTDCGRFLEALVTVSLPVEAGSVEDLAVRFSLPDMIVREWIELYGYGETERLCASMNLPAPTTIRVNTLVTTVEQCRASLFGEGIEAQVTSLSPVGLRLSKRINTQSLQSFKAGYFEMQDEGSQLISMLTGAKAGDTVIDACAGGGGKTLHLAALMEDQGALVSIDVEEARLNNIRQRLTRARVSIAKLYLHRESETIGLYSGKADSVLIDAPCSGVGTFRRNPGAKPSFTEGFVDRITQTQRSVLEEYAAFVRPGGRLVYSTCTLLRKENEEQVEGFLLRHADFELLSASEVLSQRGVHIESSGPYLTLLPCKTMTDGFFAAVLIRRD